MRILLYKRFIAMLIVSFFMFSDYGISQPPPPPGGGGTQDSKSGGNQTGGGAPIGGGLFILLGLGAAYGGRKLYQMRKESLEE